MGKGSRLKSLKAIVLAATVFVGPGAAKATNTLFVWQAMQHRKSGQHGPLPNWFSTAIPLSTGAFDNERESQIAMQS